MLKNVAQVIDSADRTHYAGGHARCSTVEPFRSGRKWKVKTRSPVNPEFFRIYHIDQGVDVVKSIPNGIDRVQHYQLRVTVSELGKLFDGTEQLVSNSP